MTSTNEFFCFIEFVNFFKNRKRISLWPFHMNRNDGNNELCSTYFIFVIFYVTIRYVYVNLIKIKITYTFKAKPDLSNRLHP